MNTIPTTVESTSAGFQPSFKPVFTADRHADALACVAIISTTTLEEVWRKAEELGLPKTGPYNHLIDGDFLAKLFAGFGWVASVWKECDKPSQLPDLSLALVDYSIAWEIGRYVVIHKAKGSHDAKFVTYAVDPAAKDQKQQVRTDIDVLAPAWYISVHPMKNAAVSGKK